MRVLWFSVTPSLFSPKGVMHNAGGWIASLEKIMHSCEEVDLGVAFIYNDKKFKYENNGVCYYPIAPYSKILFHKLWSNSDNVEKYLRVIDDFKPDIIQVFGSENDFGKICFHTKIPVIIHIQGCIPPYRNALFPVDMNQYDFLFTRGMSLKRRWIGLRSKPNFKKVGERETSIIQHCKYFMGRTDWDKGLVDLFNPKAKYFHCEEALRDSFIKSEVFWKHKENGKIRIVSTISNPWYKGVDLVLKTAKLLKKYTTLDLEWDVFGIQDIRFYEHKYKIRANDVNVNIKGIASKEILTSALLNASCYVHPSYIDNSPNSVCEAQYLGVPVAACNVGGVSSLLENGKAGILVPANDPYTMAEKIKTICCDKKLAIGISEAEIELAHKRHNPELIKEQLLNIYKAILRNE